VENGFVDQTSHRAVTGVTAFLPFSLPDSLYVAGTVMPLPYFEVTRTVAIE